MPRTPAALPPAMKNRGIAALIWELPEPGTDWPHQAREAWFEYARKTVEVVYGPVILNAARGKISPSISSPSDTPERASGGVIGQARYQIEPDGTASVRTGNNNRPVDPGDIPSGTVVHDYRPQPVDPEYYPIMWKTQGAAKLPLPAGVIVRAATEPWATPGAANGGAEASA